MKKNPTVFIDLYKIIIFQNSRLIQIDQKPEIENLIRKYFHPDPTLYMTNPALIKMVSKLAQEIKSANVLNEEKLRSLGNGKFGISNKWRPFDFDFF